MTSRAGSRQAAQPSTPIVSTEYVARELKRIAMLAGGVIVLLVVLSFLI